MCPVSLQVGLGDYAPETQHTRLFAVFLIPLGQVVVSMVIAAAIMYRKSQPPFLSKDSLSTRLVDARRLFVAFDVDGDGKLSRKEVLSKAEEILGITEEEANAMFDKLDIDGDGTLEMREIEAQELPSLWDSAWVKLLSIIALLYGIVACGAVAFKLLGTYGPEEDISWIDCFYLATVVSTSIG